MVLFLFLEKNSEEYQTIASLISSVFPSEEAIVSIEKVIHPALLKRYLACRDEIASRWEMEAKNRHLEYNQEVDQMLWHGTRTNDVYKIAREGLDVRLSRRGGRLFGTGNFRYSYKLFTRISDFDKRQKNPFAKLLLCRFATGKSDELWYARVPSKIPARNDGIPDSGVFKQQFSVFQSDQVYVNFIVTVNPSHESAKTVCNCNCHIFDNSKVVLI